MDIAIIARALVRLMLLHEREQLLGRPAFGLEVVVVGRRGTGVHHEVDRGAAAEDMGAGDYGATPAEPFGGPRVVE